MRYREDIPPEKLTVNASDDMLLLTMVLALVIGVILTGLGVYGRQVWLIFWSIGLIIASLSFLAYEYYFKALP